MTRTVVEHVVAQDRGNLHRRKAELGDDARGVLCRAARIGGAHAGDDARAVGAAVRQRGAQALVEELVVALTVVLQALELRERDRALGERLVDQVIELAPRGEVGCRLDPVASIARADADAQRSLPRRCRRLWVTGGHRAGLSGDRMILGEFTQATSERSG